MTTDFFDQHRLLRLSSMFLLVGQVVLILSTVLHAEGDANDHHAIFATYAASANWTLVHLGQFAGMAVLLAGFVTLSLALDAQGLTARLAGRLGASTAVTALALYAALQAVDGIALKQTVTALANAPDAEKPIRFASAETMRWLEWGLRSYHDLALGLTLLIFAVAVSQVDRIPRPIAIIMGLSSLASLVQGWIAGTEGFVFLHSVAIILAWALSIAWIIWLTLSTPSFHGAEGQKSVST